MFSLSLCSFGSDLVGYFKKLFAEDDLPHANRLEFERIRRNKLNEINELKDQNLLQALQDRLSVQLPSAANDASIAPINMSVIFSNRQDGQDGHDVSQTRISAGQRSSVRI